ncbi:MAG: hypothetical protein IAG13_27430, partial [Deltaproteobacteria bacterium]|nr:hypothetical protein [Nannocystaceae bacterium]
MTHALFAALAIASAPAPWSDPLSSHHDVALVGEYVVIDSHWTLGTRVPEPARAELALPMPAEAELDGASSVR